MDPRPPLFSGNPTEAGGTGTPVVTSKFGQIVIWPVVTAWDAGAAATDWMEWWVEYSDRDDDQTAYHPQQVVTPSAPDTDPLFYVVRYTAANGTGNKPFVAMPNAARLIRIGTRRSPGAGVGSLISLALGINKLGAAWQNPGA